MSKRTFVVAVLALQAGVLQPSHAASAAPSTSCDSTVTGSRNPTADLAAVRSAVNTPVKPAGSVTVCLQGVFDFGVDLSETATNRVVINPPPEITGMSIVGISDASGNQATIRNGNQTFVFNQNPPTLVSLSIKNLRFEQPAVDAISFFSGHDNGNLEASGNVLTSVAPGKLSATTTVCEAINVTSLFSIGGRVTIKDNQLTGSCHDQNTFVNVDSGIVVTGYVPGGPFPVTNDLTADVIISGNVIRNFSNAGIDSTGPSPLVIHDNLIEPGPIANPIPNAAACTGIGIRVIGNGNDLVKNNVIHLESLSPPRSCTVGIGTGNVNDSVFLANRVEGVGAYAIVMAGASTSNVFIGNNLAGFTPSVATVGLLGTGVKGNTFVGNAGTVVPDAVAQLNAITGLTSVAGGVGDEVSDALADAWTH